MKDKVEIEDGGLLCDNINCDYHDTTILYKDYKDWINRPCPKCGENLLTLEDYNRSVLIHKTVEMYNSLTEEEKAEMKKSTSGNFKDLIKNVKGSENIDDNTEKVSMSISTHKEIKIKEVKDIKK